MAGYYNHNLTFDIPYILLLSCRLYMCMYLFLEAVEEDESGKGQIYIYASDRSFSYIWSIHFE